MRVPVQPDEPMPGPGIETLDRMVDADPVLRALCTDGPCGRAVARSKANTIWRRAQQEQQDRLAAEEQAAFAERLRLDPDFRRQHEAEQDAARLAERKRAEARCEGLGFPCRILRLAVWEQVPASVEPELRGLLRDGMAPITLVGGAIGQGKSFAMALLGLALVTKRTEARPMWVDWGELCLIPLGAEKAEWYAADTLFIDGFADGARPNDKGVERVEYLVRHRYDRDLPTVLSTNRSTAEIAELMGGGFISVLMAKGNFTLTFPARNDRRTDAKPMQRAGGTR